MPNVLKALIVFSVWALLALTSHLLLSNYQSNFCSHIKHSKLAESKTNIGTEFYLVSTLNDTLSKFQSNNNVYKSKLDIDSISFINKLIESLKNDYRLRLKINLNSNFSTSTIGRDLITQIESKIKNETTESESLEFNYYNTINKNTIDFKLLEKNKQLIDSIEQSSTTKTFYLDIESGLIKETAELISYSELLRQYLQNYTDKSMAIIGHTSVMTVILIKT